MQLSRDYSFPPTVNHSCSGSSCFLEERDDELAAKSLTLWNPTSISFDQAFRDHTKPKGRNPQPSVFRDMLSLIFELEEVEEGKPAIPVAEALTRLFLTGLIYWL